MFSNHSSKQLSGVPKLLSYYLPQFYPIPLNDEWHGPGFTEWTKVRASQPLFRGHDQPRVPHEKMGYYRLDNPNTLRMQSSFMKRAGIYGQIFYHYWFSGTQILEKPAQLLLENPEIDMNFCFCWANESWSKKWDGGSGEVILDQTYSLEDAELFIRYLIPFFKDPRYITVSGRPVLFVYRTSDIPGLGIIVELWNAICESEGIPTLYLVAVQTGETLDAANSGFSAVAERPTYHLDELYSLPRSSNIEPFSIKGAVIDYDKVSTLYCKTERNGDLPVIPGVVVSWDQSPRHGTNVLILDNRSPEHYQEWLLDALEYSYLYFDENERFVTINAWNEWAEGAYLEPDKSMGFRFIDATKDALQEFEKSNKDMLK